MRKWLARVRDRSRAWRSSTWFRVLLPLIAVFLAALAHIAVALVVGVKSDFPFAFFYLIAVFIVAWVGGPISGTVACLLTMVGVPLAASPEFKLAKLDIVRLGILVGVSLLISWVARVQRRMQERLRAANQELDSRVEARTNELANTVQLLQAEVEERKRTESALRESEQRVDWTLEAAGIGRWDLEISTGKVQRSRRYEQIFGYGAPQDDWTSDTLLRHVHPDDQTKVVQAAQAAVVSGRSFELDVRITRSDGEKRWIWLQGKVLHDDAGKAVHMLGSVRDITPQKLAETRLRTQLARLNLLDHITRGIAERQDLRSIFQVVIRSLEDNLPIDFGCICLYDPGASSLEVTCVGVRSEALAMDLAMSENAQIPIDANGLSRCVSGQLVYEPDVTLLDFPFPKRIAQGGLKSLVAAPLLAEGKVFGVMVAARRESHAFESTDCEFLRQLSEHVALASTQAQIRAALQDTYDELRRSQQSIMQQERLRALGQMASGIAHDINNAVSPVALYTESLLDNEPNLSPRTRQYLETTQRAIEDVVETVARMREFYRQQEPQQELTPVHVGTLVQQVLNLTQARWVDMAQRRGATIHAVADLAPDVPAISGIESEIREALTNLILNAVDAMPNGGDLTVRTRYCPAGARPAQVHLEVSDTGIGMDEDTLRRCLEPFFTTKGQRGTGLGLAMVYGVAQRHDAQIEFDSAVGLGTTARMVFPVRESATPAPELAAQRSLTPLRLRILVVDDDPLLLKSLRDTLEADGHSVTMANGGHEGIGAFQAALDQGEPFAIVITDLGMPYIDGRKVAAAVKGASHSTPIILLTGWGQRLLAEGDVPPHVDRVLSKPPKLRDLRVVLAECVAEAGLKSGQDHGE
ncbi:ATP-binding protein [uncultured Paludibaculum sp.]|uniref:ATP-binding protein n=1 Tax=uncultured Paludibaculum sp. TaxID=1765020 RepID=UPI002AAC052D|nr:ATP-binding protein [uncultured Paludibaculum sp.]